MMALLQAHFNVSALHPHDACGAPSRSLRTSTHFRHDTSSSRFWWQACAFRRQKHYRGSTCYAYAALSSGTLQWVSAASSAVLMFSKGELELPFLTMLLVISAPYEAINLRGSQAGIVISLAIVFYLAFQHFSRSGSLQKAFDQASIISTLAIICLASVSCILLF